MLERLARSEITLEMLGLKPAAEPMIRHMPVPAFAYESYFGQHAACGLHVFESHGRMVFIATELPKNPGTSITNRAEIVAETIEEDFGLPHVFGENPRNGNYTYVEHYPRNKRLGGFDESFCIVTFRKVQCQPSFYAHPSWMPVGREQIERLLGAPFEGFKFDAQ